MLHINRYTVLYTLMLHINRYTVLYTLNLTTNYSAYPIKMLTAGVTSRQGILIPPRHLHYT
jgi:hypothetical protein